MLDGKVALITGAGQGIGQGIALALAQRGARVAAVGRTLSKCEATVNLIAQRGGEAIAVRCDVKAPGDLENAVAATVTRFGTIDILVNNAQEFYIGPLLDLGDTEYSASFASGPQAAFRLMKFCHSYLKAGKGCIINVASTGPMLPDVRGNGIYNAAKEAIRTLTRAAAYEWGPDGIRVNAILPLARTPATEWLERERPEGVKAIYSSIPLGRPGDPETDIGRFVAVLCSGDCAYVTGQSIAVDGGSLRVG